MFEPIDPELFEIKATTLNCSGVVDMPDGDGWILVGYGFSTSQYGFLHSFLWKRPKEDVFINVQST